jgi:hypothetical protein
VTSRGALLLIPMLSCRPTSPSASFDAASVPDASSEASDDAQPSASTDAAETAHDSGSLAEIARRLRGDCSDDAGLSAPIIPLDLPSWLAAHHASFPPDKSCWGVPPSGGARANLCTCYGELYLPASDLLLVCSRPHEDPAYGWSSNTVLYAIEGSALRAVLDVPTGMSGNNFELLVPPIRFFPILRGDAIVFTEGRCKACPIAREFFAAPATDPTWTHARSAYANVCAIGSAEWKWSGHTLVRTSGGSPRAIPVPTSR